MKGRKVYVIGVGMTKFEKPGRRDNFDYPVSHSQSYLSCSPPACLPASDSPAPGLLAHGYWLLVLGF